MNINYLKLRNLQIGYTLPSQWSEKINLKHLRVYSMMQNLFSIDNLGDMKIDPELTRGIGNPISYEQSHQLRSINYVLT